MNLSVARPFVVVSLPLLLGAAQVQSPTGPRLFDVLDFEDVPAGTVLELTHGRYGTGPVGVRGINPSLGTLNAAVVFDSSEPTGGDDDLGTPNEDFGGPGEGDGGDSGSAYPNDRPLGNLLIVGGDLDDADGDGLVDDPGDADELGSALVFDFSELGGVKLESMKVIDVEGASAPATVEMFDGNGLLLSTQVLPNVGNNGVGQVHLGNVANVHSLLVTLNGSAAIDEIRYELPPFGRIAGRVWNDVNGNGLQDSLEPGLPGIAVALSPTGPAPAGGSAVTDADGSYVIKLIPPGSYTLEVDEASLPADFVATACDVGEDDTADSDCSPLAVDVAPYQILSSTDFGYLVGCDGTIGNLVFLDINGNHVQDAEDVGFAGAVLKLRDAQGVLLQTMITDSDGHYEFTGICAGTYTLEIDSDGVEANFGPSVCGQGDDEALDSECGPVCVTLSEFLTEGGGTTQDFTIDFGFASCSGTCDGKIDALSLRYLGDAPAFIEVVQNPSGILVFADVVAPNGAFSFLGMDNQDTLGRKIDIFVDGVFAEQIHTSCSFPIFVGMEQGDFRVLAGTSRFGGALCEE